MKTKAEMLFFLKSKVTQATILDGVYFSVGEWQFSREECIAKVITHFGADILFIVRSSSLFEDQEHCSNAGKYISVSNVTVHNLKESIERVVSSFENSSLENQVLIQPMLLEVKLAGVLFTKDPSTGADYYVVNYDESGLTDVITSGSSGYLKTKIVAKSNKHVSTEWIQKLILLAQELEALLSIDSLDIEFAVDQGGECFLFQVRPLVCKKSLAISQCHYLDLITEKLEKHIKRHPYLFGEKSILGVMPDWNPAEIIGIRPRPLALSLYKDLVTDAIWAYQRDNYGYKNLRGFPLILDFFGLPYIDVRVSFNSFIPKTLSAELSEKLASYYLDRLRVSPWLHDKVEFDIVFSCYTFDLKKRISILQEYGFSGEEVVEITNSLHYLTNTIVNKNLGMLRADIQKIEILEQRRLQILEANVDVVTKIYWLLEDCKRYGTLPFAGLARAGFIAVQMLDSLVSCGILSKEERSFFIEDLNTVSSHMKYDLQTLSKELFLEKYGHLRPGTYDILSARYDEEPDFYFDWDNLEKTYHERKSSFKLSLKQMECINHLLKENSFEGDVVELCKFISFAIESREYSKFIFTKSVSIVLSLLKELGVQYGFSTDEMSYVDIQAITRLYGSCRDSKEELEASIIRGKNSYAIGTQLLLPAVITSSSDIWSFENFDNKPNFVTIHSVTGTVVKDLKQPDLFQGAILFIPNADPGFDWIFTKKIGGLVTTYGGVNSHMAIRAGELGIPAIIGAGEKLYQEWSAASKLHIDCAKNTVEVIY